MSADTMKCPNCGLPQPSRHVFCARCDATLRISGAAAKEAMARAGLLADGLDDLELPADATPDPTGSGTAESPLPPEGPAWVAPSEAARRSWGMPERSGRAKRRRTTNSGVRTSGDVPAPRPTLSADRLPAARPTLSADRLPAARPTLSADRLPAAPVTDGRMGAPRTTGRMEAADYPESETSPPRGRPPGALYASENRGPDDDPLMAALLDGIGGDSGPLPMPTPAIEPGLPPVRSTNPGVAPPSQRSAGRGRVVPPSRGRRRPSTNAARNDPRGRQIAMHPDELDTMRRAGITREAASRDADRSPLTDRSPLRERSQPVAYAGGGYVDPAETPEAMPAVTTSSPNALADAPLAGYTPSPRAAPDAPKGTASGRWQPPPPPSSGIEPRRLFAVGVMLAALALSALGASAGLSRYGNLQAIEGVLDGGIGPNGPVPALPADLDRVLAERGLTGKVLHRVQEIRAAQAEFEIRVELQQSVFGVPLSYQVGREGGCDIGSLLPTADFYRSEGWAFDAALESRLEDYKGSGSSEVRKVTSQAKVPLLVEDSGANLPSQSEDGEGEGETEGETPAP